MDQRPQAGPGRLDIAGLQPDAGKDMTQRGQQVSEVFQRTPDERNLYTYRVRIEGFDGDEISDNDEAINVLKRKKFYLVDGGTIGRLEAVN